MAGRFQQSKGDEQMKINHSDATFVMHDSGGPSAWVIVWEHQLDFNDTSMWGQPGTLVDDLHGATYESYGNWIRFSSRPVRL